MKVKLFGVIVCLGIVMATMTMPMPSPRIRQRSIQDKVDRLPPMGYLHLSAGEYHLNGLEIGEAKSIQGDGFGTRLYITDTIHLHDGSALRDVNIIAEADFGEDAILVDGQNQCVIYTCDAYAPPTKLLDGITVFCPTATGTGIRLAGVVALNHFGAISIRGFENGLVLERNGWGYVNGNNFDSVVIWGSKHLMRLESDDGNCQGNIFNAIQLQPTTGITESGLSVINSHYNQFRCVFGWDWAGGDTVYFAEDAHWNIAYGYIPKVNNESPTSIVVKEFDLPQK